MESIAIAVISSGLLSTIINQACNAWNRHQEEKKGSTAAMRLVLKDRLRGLAAHYIEQGWIYEDELHDIVEMHLMYHNTLKGNGYLDSLMARVKSLEIRGVGR